VPGVPCRTGIECNRPEGLFIGGKPLVQVTSLSRVRRGRFFFDYPSDRIYMANDPRGRRVEASVGDGAFRSTHHFARGVVIKNLVIERFANPSRTGAIYTSVSPGWVIVRNEIALNHGAGINHFSRARIRNNDIHHNGQLGLSGYRVVNAVVARNEIARNAIGGFAGWEAGGAKYVGTRDLTLGGNYVHDNRHHGLWTDTDNVGTVFAGNRIVRNKGSGIFHEASYDAIIRNNQIVRNGADGILISSSSGVEAFGNTLAWNRGWGIHLFIDGAQGYDLADNLIHGNLIKMRDETHNGITTMSTADPGVYSSSKNNRFRKNAYVVPRLSATYWFWGERFRTWKQWRAAGQDRNGTIRKL
jgi:parallel beta-helix repeat protein